VFIIVQVLAGDVVFGNFARNHLRDIGVFSVLHSVNGIGFERVAFFGQLLNAFRIRTGGAGNLLNIARLTG
jgi:hypothetical protein